MRSSFALFFLFVLFAITVVNVNANERKENVFPEQITIDINQERISFVGLNGAKKMMDGNDTADDGGDDDGSIWTNKWLWIVVGVCLLIIVLLIGILVVKQCLCEKKRKMKYNKLDIESTYGSHAPITEKHRADMEAKYGKLSSDY